MGTCRGAVSAPGNGKEDTGLEQNLGFKYFYGTESESFTFYRIPKALMTEEVFKVLTSDAKILYGLMLDRMSLSAKNGWFDEDGRVYIYYSIEDVMEAMGCSKNKGMKTLQELDIATGIGLIERKKQGQGKPTIIYVKNFELGKTVSESQNVGFKTPKICDSRISKDGNLDSQDLSPNENKYNNNLLSYTDSNLILSADEKRSDGIDVNAYAELVKENIEFDILCERYRFDRELIEGIYEIIVETVVSQSDTIVINCTKYPMSIVRSKFLKLNMSHIEYVLDCLKANTTKVRNIKKYMLAMLFNAPSTISSYYQAEVNHDFPQYAKAK